MIRNIVCTAVFALSLASAQGIAVQEPSQENAKSRLDRQETVHSIVQAGRMPAPQKNEKLDAAWKDPSAGTTPRSDFLFCTGMAYLGDYRAQRCVGSAYENARGIVEDLSEAYAWYGVALENPNAPDNAKTVIEADKERVKARLTGAYPHPTDDEMDDMVNQLKNRIAQYQNEAKAKQ